MVDRRRVKVNLGQGVKPAWEKNTPVIEILNGEEFLVYTKKFIMDKQVEGLKPRTLEDYKIHFRYITQWLLDTSRSSQNRTDELKKIRVDKEFVKSYHYYLVYDKKYKETTVNTRLRTLKSDLNWLYKEGLTEEKLSEYIKLMKVDIDLVHPLSEKDIKKIIKMPERETYMGLRDYTIMLLMLDTGVRVKEAVNIKVEDFLPKEDILTIRGDSAKTRKFRQLPLSNQVIHLLKKMAKISRENNCEYLFMTDYCQKLSPTTITGNFRNYGKKGGIKSRCTPHVFRHTFATNFVKRGGDVFTLQRILGHSTLATTRRYIQLNIDDLKEKHKESDILNYIFR